MPDGEKDLTKMVVVYVFEQIRSALLTGKAITFGVDKVYKWLKKGDAFHFVWSDLLIDEEMIISTTGVYQILCSTIILFRAPCIDDLFNEFCALTFDEQHIILKEIVL